MIQVQYLKWLAISYAVQRQSVQHFELGDNILSALSASFHGGLKLGRTQHNSQELHPRLCISLRLRTWLLYIWGKTNFEKPLQSNSLMFRHWCEYEKSALTVNLWQCTLFAGSNVHHLQDENLGNWGQETRLHWKPSIIHDIWFHSTRLQHCKWNTGMTKVTSWAVHGIVLAELLAYIDESRMDEDVASIFKLSNFILQG